MIVRNYIMANLHGTGLLFMVRFAMDARRVFELDHVQFHPSKNYVSKRHGTAVPGMALQTKSGLDHIPVTLLPTPFPKSQLKKALKVQQYFNKIFYRLRSDSSFITERLRETAAADPFTGRLLQMFNSLESAGVLKDQLSLSIHRNDYMLHDDMDGNESNHQSEIPSASCSIQQVEVNTISCAFGGLAPEPRRLHRYMLTKVHPPALDGAERLPTNGARDGLVDALLRAAATFNLEYKMTGSAILMVVQPGEANAFDQRVLEHELFESSAGPTIVIRKSLAEIEAEGVLRSDGILTVVERGVQHVIGVVYFRAGYCPDDFPTETEWHARETIERSKALKCPSLADHLTGAKKMQQILADKAVLQDFAVDLEDGQLDAVLSVFAGLYALDDTEQGNAIVTEAIQNPEKFVLKPQREGGGNNLYGKDMVTQLQQMTAAERAGYILMSLIKPPLYRNSILRGGNIATGAVVSELGIYGVCISHRTRGILFENTAGHLLRTKFADVLDGGVASGRAVLDSPYVYE
eukprot:m.960387 g.960387  ORF g.960387 m.960387 type:complete len:521 (+) comp23886_c3_seq2:363-1925(+)